MQPAVSDLGWAGRMAARAANRRLRDQRAEAVAREEVLAAEERRLRAQRPSHLPEPGKAWAMVCPLAFAIINSADPMACACPGTCTTWQQYDATDVAVLQLAGLLDGTGARATA